MSKAEQQLCVARLAWKRFEEIRNRLPVKEEDLNEQVGCFSATMLHAGFSLELGSKAVLIAQDPAIVDESGLKPDPPWPKGGHDLVFLVEEAGGPVSPEERELLERLVEATVWTGRYPIPMKAEVMAVVETKRQKRLVMPRDMQLIGDLFGRLREELAKHQVTHHIGMVSE